jgi:type VI secretion system ImpM family protein
LITAGFFGKIPSLGDFVSRGWSNGARAGIDGLLQQALQEVLASSNEGKQAIVMAPRLLLSIRPGVVADEGLATLVVPSEDRVGRLFPLCAGVEWNPDAPELRMGWPSLRYGHALIECLQRHAEAGGSPDGLRDEIERLGGPDRYGPTFIGPVGDETLPRLGADVKLLRVCGPMAAMSTSTRALCAALADSSELLGLVLDASGEPKDFVVGRRIVGNASALASLFDGAWDQRGWITMGAPPAAVVPPSVDPVRAIDDDATHPRQPRIDRVASAPDSAAPPERAT